MPERSPEHDSSQHQAVESAPGRGRSRADVKGQGSAQQVDLHVCPFCDSELVYPVDWAPVGRTRWNVTVRCPDCEWRGAGVHGQDVVDRFDKILDRGAEMLLDDLTMLARANFEDEIDTFVDALQRDLVLPEDF